MRVAITIATKNRRDDLARTCAELRKLNPAPDEFWICADGCTDDTVAWVKQHVPEARLIEHAVSQHSILCPSVARPCPLHGSVADHRTQVSP